MSLPSRPRLPATGGRTLEERLAEVEDRAAILDLTSRYNFDIDGRDLASVGDLFTDQAVFGSKDGAMRAVGRDALLKQFEARFSVLGATNHFAHDHVVWFESATRARGLLSAHAELWRKERTMVTALRYDDIYEKCADGLWRFAQRLLSFMYYLPIEEYATAMGRLDRNRASDTPANADYPELLPTYVEYRPAKARP